MLMGSSSGTCEIVEAKEESNFVQHNIRSSRSNYKMSDKDRTHHAMKVGNKDLLKNDINKIFEALDLKQSKSLDLSQLGKGPMRNNFKLPVATGVSRSPGTEITETVNLKQALREFSLTKASEMAAMKRLSTLASSSRASEAGRITTLYNSVVIEASYSSSSFNKTNRNVVQKSMEIDEGTSKSKKLSDDVVVPYVQSSSKSLHSPPQLAGMTTEHGTVMTQERNENVSLTRKIGTVTQQEECSSSPLCSTSTVYTGEEDESIHSSSEVVKKVGTVTQQDKCSSSLSCSSSTVYTGEEDESIHSSSKVMKKVSISKPVRKGRLQTATSSHLVKGKRVGKLSRTTARSIKPVIRSKGISKKKMKEDTIADTCTSSNYKEVIGDADPSSQRLICDRCQCAMNSAVKASKDSLASQSNHVATEVISNNETSCDGKTLTAFDRYNSSKAAIVKVKKIIKVTDKGEFSQSSKSSQGEYSSSTTTSISDESNISRSSCANRPHKAKDARWEAIRQIRTEQGVLSLTNFNLLKKLGCGDIGTVYLAELIGTNFLYAIKVMDNEFLARRKKLPRAQTEREILKMLDHPFLPTLYAQFTSDNLSCLVMEYCPGGDLHVLRQKQPGRFFPETAARFYVAEVLLALEYLHMLGVVYRDLKPENILVREDGHIMLTDFDLSLRCTVNPTLLKSSSFDGDPARVSGPCTESNCAEPFCIEPPCQVPCFTPRFLPASAKARKLKSEIANKVRSLPQLIAEPTEARSNSFVGTHEYLAPEIIKGDGHGAAVDWWTFGVFLYELLYGRTPFKGCNNEETLANVVLQSLKFPDIPFVSFQARELIRGLLVKEPENRFGSEKGAAEIKKHPFFEGLNWALIRCSPPPELVELDVPNMVSLQNKGKLLECKATGEHLEFELF